MPRIKRIIFHQYSPKIKLFLKKKRKISHPAPPAAGSFAPRPPNRAPHCEFLATRLPRFAVFIIIRVFVAFV